MNRIKRIRLATKRKRLSLSQKRLQENQERYQYLLEYLPVGVYRTTPAGRILEANPALVKMLGYESQSDLKNVNVKIMYVREKDRINHFKKLEKHISCFAEFQLRRKDGTTIWGRDYPRVVYESTGKIKYCDGILVDITREKEAEKKLKKVLKELEKSNKERQKMIQRLETQSLIDDLTGLYNRRGFFTIAQEYFQLASRKKVKMFLLFLDLDDLKIINDTFGHHTGDEALIKLADLLVKTFRRSDIKGRMGGDEFAVFPIDTTYAGVEAAVDRLMKNIESFNKEGPCPFTLSISMGISCYNPELPCTIDELFVMADKVMYEQKCLKLL